MVSGLAIAEATGRCPVVIWVPDVHCDARLTDLIAYSGLVLHNQTEAALARSRSARIWNYMEVEEGAAYGAPILVGADLDELGQKDIYVRSAYTLNSPHCQMATEQRLLRNLIAAPPVLDLMVPVRRPNAVALHIRMGTGPDFNHLPWEAPDNWPTERHAELVAWREKSHMRHFIARLDTLIAEGRAESVFLAADLPGVYAAFADRYGDRVTWLKRDLYDRSARQLQYALADLLMLTAADLFLASTWSSFSDLAQRLAWPGRPFERSGVDF